MTKDQIESLIHFLMEMGDDWLSCLSKEELDDLVQKIQQELPSSV